MEIIIKGSAEEIAALVTTIQERQKANIPVELGPGALIVCDAR